MSQSDFQNASEGRSVPENRDIVQPQPGDSIHKTDVPVARIRAGSVVWSGQPTAEQRAKAEEVAKSYFGEMELFKRKALADMRRNLERERDRRNSAPVSGPAGMPLLGVARSRQGVVMADVQPIAQAHDAFLSDSRGRSTFAMHRMANPKIEQYPSSFNHAFKPTITHNAAGDMLVEIGQGYITGGAPELSHGFALDWPNVPAIPPGAPFTSVAQPYNLTAKGPGTWLLWFCTYVDAITPTTGYVQLCDMAADQAGLDDLNSDTWHGKIVARFVNTLVNGKIRTDYRHDLYQNYEAPLYKKVSVGYRVSMFIDNPE
jgi:hypothetical protein